MRKMWKNCLPILLLTLLFITTSPAHLTASAPYQPNLGAELLSLEKIDYTNPEFTWYSARCSVENKTDKSGTVSIHLRTVNKYGFEREDIRLSKHVPAGSTEVLTLTSFMDFNMFDNIGRVYIKSIVLH